MRKISTPQIKALRALHEGSSVRVIRRQTRVSLEKRGLIDSTGLTARGRRLISDYLRETGDGPEALKDLFRV